MSNTEAPSEVPCHADIRRSTKFGLRQCVSMSSDTYKKYHMLDLEGGLKRQLVEPMETSLTTNATNYHLINMAQREGGQQQDNAQQSPEDKEFELKVINIFYLLDQDCDTTLYRDELNPLLDIVRELKDKDAVSDLGRAEIESRIDNIVKFDKYELKDFLKNADTKGIVIDDVLRMVYKKQVGCLGRSPCLWLRCKLLKALRGGFERQTPEQIHYSFVSVISDFIAQVVHFLDLISDGYLARQMYIASRGPDEQMRWGQTVPIPNEGKDYSIAFIWIAMAIFGPYIIQFSSFLNAYFIKDLFDEERWHSYNFIRQVQLFFQLSFLSLYILLPMLDIYIKVKSTLLFLFLFLFFPKATKQSYVQIRRWTEQIYYKLFKLTFYEVNSFEKQKKHTQLLFEDTLLLTLNAFIYFEILDVPILKEQGIDKKPLYFQVLTTLISFITTVVSLYIESRGLEEYFIEFMMTSVKAKQDFVPFGRQLKQVQLKKDLNFSRIEFKIWFITDLLGVYNNFEYQFNEYSIQKLATQILEGRKEYQLTRNNQNQIIQTSTFSFRYHENLQYPSLFNPKLRFGFSIHHLSVHIFLHFIDRIQSDHPDFISEQIDFAEIDFDKLIENSIELEHFKYEKTSFFSGQRGEPILCDAKTCGGKRLIQICIDNERVDDKGELISFPLKELLIKLLKGGWCNPNVFDFNDKDSLLSYCHLKRKRQSFKILLDYSQIDPNHKNKSGHNIYGILFYQSSIDSDHFTKNNFQPREHLKLLIEASQQQGRPNIQIHDQCIDMLQNGTFKSPIYCYFQRFINKIQVQNNNLIFDEEHFKRYFGITRDQFQLENDLEKLELLPLLFNGGNQRQKIINLFLNSNQQQLDKIFSDPCIDKKGNTLLHLTECAFSENKFHVLTEEYNTSFNALKPLLVAMMTKRNLYGQTPVDIIISKQQKFKKIERLLDFDILTQGCLNHCEKQFVEYITMRTIQEQNNLREYVFSDIQLNKKYFRVFQNPQKAYMQQKESFKKRGYLNLFLEKFKQPDKEFELQDQEHSQSNQLESSRLEWHIMNGQITIKDNEEIIESEVKPFNQRDINIVVKANNNCAIEQSQTIQSSGQKIKQNKHYILEASLNWLIDIVSLLDLFSDIIILLALLDKNHTSWFSFTIFTMLCPYYAVYTSLMNFQIDRNRRIREDKNLHTIYKKIQGLVTLLYILPTMLGLLIFSDIIHTILIAFFMPIFLFVSCCKKKNMVQVFEDFIDQAWHQCVGMNYMDVRGFKSQRTILQLQLESIPQIFFQCYMLIRLRQLNQKASDLGVTKSAIVFSLIMAVIHLILEVLNLYIEAATWQTGFMDYMIACHNAKINWIAQKTSFIVDSISNELETNHRNRGRYCWCLCKKSARVKAMETKVIVFDDKEKKFCGTLGFSVSFMFTDLSVEPLINIISNLPKVDDSSRKITVELGSCIRELSSKKLRHLLELSYKKVNLKFVNPEIYLRKIFSTDMELMQQINRGLQNDEEEPILIDLVKKNYHQVLRVLLNLGAKIDLYDNDLKKSSIVSIAYRNRYRDSLRELLNILDRGREHEINFISQSIRSNQMFFNEIFLRSSAIKCTLYPPLIMQPLFLIAYEMQQSFLYSLPKIIEEKSEKVARDQFDYIWGAFVPEIIFKVGDKLEEYIPKIEQWQSRYPQQYTLKYGNFQGKFDSRFLSHFAGFRNELYLLSVQSDREPINKLFQGIIDIDKFDFEIQDLVAIQQIICDKNFNGPININQCDFVINKLGLDKKRDVYFNKSREIAANHGIINLTFEDSNDYQLDPRNGLLEYEVPLNVAAIKSAQLCIKRSNLRQLRSQTQTLKVTEFHYVLDHLQSELRNQFVVSLPEEASYINDDEDENDDELVCLLDFEIEKQYTQDRLQEIKIRNTLLMNVQGGNIIKFKLQLDNMPQDSTVEFTLSFEFYSKLEQ